MTKTRTRAWSLIAGGTIVITYRGRGRHPGRDAPHRQRRRLDVDHGRRHIHRGGQRQGAEGGRT
ncbi:MAG: hypothetical protein R2838_09830 [Caldilineaceae bacterium]